MKPEDFDDEFHALTGWRPLRWHQRLFHRFLRPEHPIPSSIDLPTGLGKTSVMPIWYLARRAGACLPRRLVYVVDRRAVVDQATTEAEKILRRDPQLAISTLRGRHADRGDWLRNPAAEAIVVGTVDMIGSRLLFSGYGVSRRMRPYHAGLLGADSLVILDESHLVPPFERLLEQIAAREGYGPRDDPDGRLIPRFQLLPLSATGRESRDDDFALIEEDADDPIVRQRTEAEKHLSFFASAGKLEADLADRAWELSEQGTRPGRYLIYCDRRSVAVKTRAALEAYTRKAKTEVDLELFVGARRVREREFLAEWLRLHGFNSGSVVQSQRPAFVVATSAGEVGVDLDADHVVMDSVPFERVVQRLGRVNRLGGDNRVAEIILIHGSDDDARRQSCTSLLRHLPVVAGDSRFASPTALAALKAAHPEAVREASTPEPLYPALGRALVDAWSMTSLVRHTGRPQVRPWLRGWTEDDPQTTLVWRMKIPARLSGEPATAAEVAAFFEAAPPHLSETLETNTDSVVSWLIDRGRKLGRRLADETAGSVGGSSTGTDRWERSTVVAIALAPAGDDPLVLRLDDLLDSAESMRAKNSLRRSILERILVVNARLGGLSPDGIFDPSSSDPVTPTLDGEEDADHAWQEVVGWRVLTVGDEYEGGDPDWQKPHFFDLVRGAEGEPLQRLVVEKRRSDFETEDERALSPVRAQLLDVHQEWTAAEARQLVASLGLEGEIGAAIILAARLHDEGKRARRWQQAFNAPDGKVYAKTRGPIRQQILGGYRHEFGSLAWVERDEAFKRLSAEIQDLVLHLVAAHHGRARPLIDTAGCENAPPSALEFRAQQVARRFARLQRRFGPWGLAWLESIVRAADARASRANDEGQEDG